MRLLLPIWIVVFAVSSCVNTQKNERLRYINKLQQQMDDVEKQLSLISPQKIKKKVDSISYTLSEIETAYKGDTFSISFAQTISQYKVAQQQFQQAISESNALSNAIASEKKQLASLYNDIQSDVGKREKYNEYLQTEKKNTMRVKCVFSTYISMLQSAEKKYTANQPNVLRILQQMQSK